MSRRPRSARPEPSERLGAGARLTRALALIVITVLTGALVAALALPAVGGIGIFTRDTIGEITFTDLPPELQQPPLSQRSVILAADGTELATFYYENRQSVALADVAPIMQNAIVAIEDSRFYEHHGVDPKGIMRALVKDSSTGEATQGASTITQQYVRQALVETNVANDNVAGARAAVDKNLARKITEARYALALEKKLTKPEILEDYLNTVYFGSGAYGVSAAAQHYFSESAADLSLPQAALLSGIINNPSTYNPILNPNNAMQRRNVVLQRMADLDYITQSAADEAKLSPLGLKVSEIPNGCSTSSAPYFCQYVVAEFLNDTSFLNSREARANLLRRGGLVISTTLDMKMQKAAKDAVDSVVPPDPTKNAGLAAAIDLVEPKTGAIKAMAVDRKFGKGPGETELNLAADAAHDGSTGRFAGSTFKVFVLAAAFEQGIPVGTRINSPNRIVIPKGATTDCDGNPSAEWHVANAGDSESGNFNLLQGTWYSVNTYYAQLEVRTGICRPVQIAESMGVRLSTGGPLKQNISFVLGAEEVDPLSIAGAFATLANQGMFCKPQAITKVTTSIEGLKLPDIPGPQCEQVLDRNVANAVTSLLTGVITQPGGTGAGLGIGRPAAGKTGTDDDYKNGWFSGYTPNLAGSVWVGNPDSATPMRNVTVNGKRYPQVFGATLAGKIWKQAMTEAVKPLPVQNFVRPPTRVLEGDPITVPDVIGLDPGDAKAKLEQLGFLVATDMPQVPSTQPQGKVDSTSPGAGAVGHVGDPVTLMISNGTPPAPSGSPPASGAPGSPPASSEASPPASTEPLPKPTHDKKPKPPKPPGH